MKSKVKITKETYIWKNEDEEGVIYYKDGKKHREDGPAVELKNGSSQWFINGNLHREDGPAVEGCDGTREWYNRAVKLSEEEFKCQNKAFNPKRLHEVRSAYERPVKAVENKILALRKKYIEGEGTSGIKIRW